MHIQQFLIEIMSMMSSWKCDVSQTIEIESVQSADRKKSKREARRRESSE